MFEKGGKFTGAIFLASIFATKNLLLNMYHLLILTI